MKKVLISNEFHELNTGYATYGKYLLEHLYATGKYEIAEFATYGKISDIIKRPRKWKTYSVMPEKGSPEWPTYKAEESNQFGKWRFDRVLLDFRPDVVLDIRDWYMCQYQFMSPLRDYFSWLIMPPIDCEPMREEWINIAQNAQGILTWCDWSKNILKKYTYDTTKFMGVAPYAVCPHFFPASNKAAHKESMGLQPNAKIVGTVMRNQVRKLFPELMKAFRDFLDSSGRDDVYLYLHTSYPDREAWDIPSLIKDFNLGSKVLCSYVCKNCYKWFPSIFADANVVCKFCNQLKCGTANVLVGLTPEQLNELYNLFDLYVQYSDSEGSGFPTLEAAACGVPIMGIDHSGTHDWLKNLNGQTIAVQRETCKIGDSSWRAMPDNNDLVAKLIRFFEKPQQIRDRDGNKTRKLAEEKYTWEHTTKIWEAAIDAMPPPRYSWNDPPRVTRIPTSYPENLSNKQFMCWLFDNVLHQPENKYRLLGLDVLKDLNYGAIIQNKKMEEVDKHKMFQLFCRLAENKNHAEQCRTGLLGMADPDYIKLARALPNA